MTSLLFMRKQISMEGFLHDVLFRYLASASGVLLFSLSLECFKARHISRS